MVVKNYGLYEDILQTLISNLMTDRNVLTALHISFEFQKRTITDQIKRALYGPVFTDFCNECRKKDLELTVGFKKPSLYKTVEAALPIMLTSLASQLKISSALLKFHLKRYERDFLKITRTVLPKVDKAFIPLKKLIEERVTKLYGQDFFTKFSHDTSKEPLFSLMELYSNDQVLIDLVEEQITSKISIEGVSTASIKHHWQFMVQSMCPPVLEEKFEDKFLRITRYTVDEYKYLISILITVTNYGLGQQAFEDLIQNVKHNPVFFFRKKEIKKALLTPVYSVLSDAINTKKLPLEQALKTVFPTLINTLRIENDSDEYLELEIAVNLFICQFLKDANKYASSNLKFVKLLRLQLIESFIKQYYGNDFFEKYPKLTLKDVYLQDKELMLLVIREMNANMEKQKIQMQFNEEKTKNKIIDPIRVKKFFAVTGKTPEQIKKEIVEQKAIQTLTSSKATFLSKELPTISNIPLDIPCPPSCLGSS